MNNKLNMTQEASSYQSMSSCFHELIDSKEYYVAFIDKINDFIIYGAFYDGFKNELGRFQVQDEDALKKIYELLQIDFADTFECGWTHSSSGSWSLLPSLDESLLVEIKGRSTDDIKWIYDEIQHINEEYRKRNSFNK